MTAAERRERARLRSERWRRAHGIMPRRRAQKPWLAEGVLRSTWYRRGNRISDVRNRTEGTILDLTRASSFVAQLQAELAEVARCQANTAAIIGKMTAAIAYPEKEAPTQDTGKSHVPDLAPRRTRASG